VKYPLPCTNGRFAASPDIERLYERVRLVSGKGSRRHGRLCIMTFVALLAGERHTDAPETASPVIRHFAIALNDGMPDDERQRLKPFAPRIIGTRDARDEERVELLRRAMRDEIAPRLGKDVGCLRDESYLDEAQLAPHRVGAEVAKVLVQHGCEGVPDASRSWYWAKGIELLDRLCDLGRSDCSIAVGADQLARADAALKGSWGLEEVSHLIASAITGLKHRFRDTSAGAGESEGKPVAALQTGIYLH
jgi:hypothetical protein